MSWLIYRQHRQQALFGAATLALLALFLGLTGLHMSSVFHNSGLAHCLSSRSHNDCGDLESSFESRFSSLRQLVPKGASEPADSPFPQPGAASPPAASPTR